MYNIKHNLNHMYIKYLKHRELDDFYISVFLKHFAESFIAIFVPIYLFTLGYGIKEIAIFFGVIYLLMTIFMFIGLKLCSYIGVKKVLVIGSFFLLLTNYFLHQIPLGTHYLIAALVLGLSHGMYYAAYHVDFTKSAVAQEEASEVSVIKRIMIITAATGPLIGAYLITKISYSFVFILVAILLAISIVPLFLTKDFKIPKEKITLKKIFKADSYSKSLAYKVEGAMYFGDSTFWPLFIFLILGNVLSLGLIFSLSSLITIFLLAKIGKLADKYTRTTFKTGIFTYIPLWALRLLLLTPIGFFITNFLSNISKSLLDISFNKIVYQDAEKRTNLISYFTFRENNLAIGRIFMAAILFFTESLIVLFVITASITLFYLPLAKRITNNAVTQ